MDVAAASGAQFAFFSCNVLLSFGAFLLLQERVHLFD